MRIFACLWLIISLLSPFAARSAETAAARLTCLSLQFQQGRDSFGDTLDLSTVSGTPNGELAPYNGLTYISGMVLDVTGQPLNGTIQLNLPPYSDVNSNGFNDFFESAVGVFATTSGTYTTDVSSGTVTANWQRAGGSQEGNCSLHLVDNAFGDLGTFTSVFDLLEYAGPLLYTPGTSLVNGNLNVVQTGLPSSQILGPVQFVKVATNRFNQLVLQPGSWTNNAAQMLSYTNALLQRGPPWNTNYLGFIQFADGNPNTPDPDYFYWALSINDTNDVNHNGIPDFSDDPSTTTPPPNPPSLALTWTTTNLLLSVTGDLGHRHDLQQTLSLPPTNWQVVLSVTLTSAPQIISIPIPTNSSAFWRAVAH